MAEAPAENEVDYADYYQCSGGFTVGNNACAEGEVIEGSAMGFTKENPPLSEDDQLKKFGRVLYKEYEPEEGEDLVPIQTVSRTIRALQGMQTPDMPPVTPTPNISEVPLDMLSRPELRSKAKSLGLNFPEDTDRDQMIGAIEKKQKENAESDEVEGEPEIVSKRRANAKKVIEANNALIASGGSSAPASPPPSEAPAEEEEPA